MAIYKEVDELLKAMDTWDKYGVSFGLFRLNKSNENDYVPYVRYEDMVRAVTGTPHADVAPVIHAKWNFHYYDSGYKASMTCSACGGSMDSDAMDISDYVYCPCCGAKMDEEQ